MRGREPEGYVGVFQRFADVVPRHRLSNHSMMFADRDVWAAFIDADDRRAWLRTSNVQAIERVEREWKEHMAERGRHHALATPEDVNEFVTNSLQVRAVATTQHPYWAFIEGFYSWLQSRTDYPHLYHPVRMAAIEYTESYAVWTYRISHRDRHAEDRD